MSAATTFPPRPATLVETAPTPDLEALGAFVAASLEDVAGQARTVMVNVPAPTVAPDALLRATRGQRGFLWDPPDGTAVAGAGAAHRFDLRGSSRFADLRSAAESVWRRLKVVDHPRVAYGLAPRFYGGFAFTEGAADMPPWEGFGDGCALLPTYRYARCAGGAVLSLTLRGEDELAAPEAASAHARTLVELLVALERTAGQPQQEAIVPELRRLHLPSAARWCAQVEALRDAIRAGRYAKVVAAGRSIAELAGPVSSLTVLERLSRGLKASTRFAFGCDGATFLGATPERLVARRGARIETEALAGSIAVGEAQARQLLASQKDLQEHELVVEEIVRRLQPLCASLEVAAAPRIRTLREVLHLHTPITGILRAPRHVLELVEALHPTPAVGGVPSQAAIRWIAEHEPDARGWYAGPVGWFDAAGDGEFVVALRSCVLRGARAYLYAGAGIVADSDPTLEYHETELKKQALLAALGA